MKNLKHLLILIFITNLGITVIGQTSAKTFIGNWKTTQEDKRSYSVSEETWIFENAKSGIWERKLIVSGNSIICFLKNPFIWQIKASNKVKITLGKTDCKCTARQKKFEDGLDNFIKNLKASYNNEFFEYKYRIIDSTIIYFDNIKLTKQ